MSFYRVFKVLRSIRPLLSYVPFRFGTYQCNFYLEKKIKDDNFLLTETMLTHFLYF
jgi:hypothetical protein